MDLYFSIQGTTYGFRIEISIHGSINGYPMPGKDRDGDSGKYTTTYTDTDFLKAIEKGRLGSWYPSSSRCCRLYPRYGLPAIASTRRGRKAIESKSWDGTTLVNDERYLSTYGKMTSTDSEYRSGCEPRPLTSTSRCESYDNGSVEILKR